MLLTAGAVGTKLMLGLAAAMLLTQQFPLRGLVRALAFLPWAVPGLVAALGWRWLLDEQSGVVNALMLMSGLSDRRYELRPIQPCADRISAWQRYAATQSRRLCAQRWHHGEMHFLRAAHQGGQIQAEAEKRELKDGEFTTACAQSCASKALVFGDLNDPTSEVSRLSSSNRGTKLLGELGTRPNVTYLERGTWEDAKNG